MPVTHVSPVARQRPPRPQIRPISGFSVRDVFGQPAVGLTADRRQGVGTPTVVATAAPSTPESARPSPALIQETVDTALDALDSLERQTRDVARRFRRGAYADAQVGLRELMRSTQTLLRLATMAADASGTTLDTLCQRHDLRVEFQTHLAVNELIQQQLREDWGGLAAALDRVFTAALEGWRRVFIALGGNPTGPYGHAA